MQINSGRRVNVPYPPALQTNDQIEKYDSAFYPFQKQLQNEIVGKKWVKWHLE